VRLYHPESEGFIQAWETPLYKNPKNHGTQLTKKTKFILTWNKVFIKTEKKNETSSNELFQIELWNSLQRDALTWKVECCFKHLGFESYLYVDADRRHGNNNNNNNNNDYMYMGLTSNLQNENTLFVLIPVDKVCNLCCIKRMNMSQL
jgi:hypothetical protein